MSIDAKIAEIMEESKLLGLGEDFISEEEYDSLDEEEQALYELSAGIKQRAYVKRYWSDKEGDDEKADKTLSHIRKREGQKGALKAALAANPPPSEHIKQIKRDFLAKESFNLEDYSVEELEDFMMSEEFEQLDELSKKTLGSYINKASASGAAGYKKYGATKGNDVSGLKLANKRQKGISRAIDKLTKESFDVSADVDALMFGETLSEEFKEKATTIFEAAVVSRVKEEVARLEEEFEEQLDEQVDSITEGLVEKIDGYLDYVVESWIEQNEIALEAGLKSDIMESFITGMKGLFEEHYIDVPEERYDVISEMEAKIDALESKLDEQVERNIDLKRSLSESVRKEIVNVFSDGLTNTESEKFSALVEELSYDDEYSFKTKVQTIRENYFSGRPSTLIESFVSDTPVEELNESQYRNIDPTVAAYAKALKQYNN
jgi:SHS2 domain-containing protein